MASNKMMKMAIVSVALLLSLTCVLQASADRVTQLKKALNKTYQSLSSYEADFKQVNYWQEQDLTLESTGLIAIEGDKFALIYSKPEGQRIIVDGLVYIIDDEEKTMIVADTEEQLNPARVINYFWDKSKVEIKSETDKDIIVVLLPLEDESIKEIEVSIKKKDSLILDIDYIDFDGNKVIFTFYNERINRLLDKKTFEIPIDKGYSVIDQSSH